MILHDTDSARDLEDGKACFDTAYNGDEPVEYFRELGQLEYQIPHHGQQVFAALLAALPRTSEGAPANRQPTVLDLCCSYGINGALLTCDIDLAHLQSHYLERGRSRNPQSEDRAFFAERRRPDAPRVVGVDIADRAVSYGCRVGLLDAGFAENLEEDRPSKALASEVARTDLITVTGGVGYISATTFDRLLAEADRDRLPWVAAFCLRRFSYHDIADVAAGYGLVTERLVGRTFPQRRFACEEEREFTVRHLGAAGLDLSRRESTGYFHTDFYLSRPAADVAARSLPALLPDLAAGGAARV